jgi:FtsP/CotA-like multicopper oxidase with cupredoxin domain
MKLIEKFLLVVAMLIGAVTVCQAELVQYELSIAHKDMNSVSFSGDEVTRTGALFNGVMPGPTIEANLGDDLEITIHNNMPKSGITVHFHGQHQKGTHFMDGTHGITQCDIAPMQSFTYKFKAEPAGTFLYHSHLPYQYGDGAWGAMVIHDPDDPYAGQYSGEFVVAINDWLAYYSDRVFQYVSQFRFDVWPLSYHTSYINGRDAADPEVYTVSSGNTYRLRFAQIGVEYAHRIQIAGHRMTVIAVDGAYVEPQTVDFLDLFSGYRVDVLVTANQSPGTYEIRAAVISYTNAFVGSYTSAHLHYSGSSSGVVAATAVMAGHDYDPAAYTLLDEASLRAYKDNDGNFHQSYTAPPDDAVQPSEIDYYYTASYGVNDWERAVFMDGWNKEIFELPVEPLVFTKGNHGLAKERTFEYQAYSDSNVKGTATLKTITRELAHNQVVDIVFQNIATQQNELAFTGALHPNHLHGHYFWVLGSGSGSAFDPQTDIASLNFDNPVQRDTVTVYPDSWLAVRFVADNRGAFIMHCHSETHTVFGMDVVYLIDKDDWPDLPDDFPRCTACNSATRASISALSFVLLSIFFVVFF